MEFFILDHSRAEPFLFTGPCCHRRRSKTIQLALSSHVRGNVDFVRQFRNVHLEARLHFFEDLLVLLGADKGNSNTLGTETTRTADAVQELITVIGCLLSLLSR
jgi:hypothetical protein